MTVEKPTSKLQPIRTGANRAINRSEFRAVACKFRKAREKSQVQAAIGFCFASHWLKN